MLNYTVTIRWNHKIVLHGTMSAVLAYTVLQHTLIDNFAGPTVNRATATCPTLKQLLELPANQQMTREVYDDTGHARVTIERVAH